MNRAYSTIVLKSVDEDKRILEGIASTPTPDRVGDVVVPEGMEFKVPFPFLYQHNSRQPIGNVVKATVSSEGMRVWVQLAKGGVAPYIDEAWALIKEGLVRGLSIGFRSLEESWDKALNGFRYLRTEIMELSAVTIPANAEASITSIKSISCEQLAAIGKEQRNAERLDKSNLPGASGKSERKIQMKTTAEQIAGFEATLTANKDRQEAIRAKSAEAGRVMDATEAEEFDTLSENNKTIVAEITRLKQYEKQMAQTAKPVGVVDSPESGAKARSLVTVRAPQLPLGTAFTRYALALMRAKGNLPQALEISKQWHDQTPEVEAVLKVAVAAGTTTADGWASELAQYTYMSQEFIELLRPQTIIGKIPGLRRVPFNITLPLQDSGSSVGWVGEQAQKPVSKLHFDTVNFRFAKAAGIVVLTDELVRYSNPSAEALVRTDLAAAISQFLDEQFIDPTVTAVANVSPASITQGAGNIAASGTTATDFRNDLGDALTQMVNANVDPSGMHIVMQPTLAVALSLLRNALGQQEFPGITASGGTCEGYPVVTSNSVPVGVVVFVKPSEILLADEGGINLDASTEASLVMDDNVSPAGTTLVSLWQKNMIALRAERIINWARRRNAAVFYITAAGYGGASPS